MNKVRSLQRALGSPMDEGYPARHEQITREILAVLGRVDSEGLFSPNEEIDDVSTSSLEFMDLWYTLGLHLDATKIERDGGVVGRLQILQKSVKAYLKFMTLLDNYGLLVVPLKSFYDRVTQNSLFDLSKSPPTSREQKIERYALQRVTRDAFDAQMLASSDEEDRRKALLAKLTYQSIEAWNNIANNAQELEMLGGMAGLDSAAVLREGGVGESETRFADLRVKQQAQQAQQQAQAQQANRVENPSNQGPIISNKKIMRPFTLTRTKAQAAVFGTGQVLPSMSVEELVDQELANGGMLKPEQEQPEDDEDDYRWQNKETERLRKWDDFKDANPRGSGNTMNLG